MNRESRLPGRAGKGAEVSQAVRHRLYPVPPPQPTGRGRPVRSARWQTFDPRLRAGRPRFQEAPVGAESEEVEPVMEAS